MREGRIQEKSDFWWLATDEAVKYKYVYVCYQEPYSDEPNSNKDPSSVSRFHSLDTNGNLSEIERRYPLGFIDQWREKCANTNVFRSFGLFDAEHDGEELLGPFLIDIDREEDQLGKGYVQDINGALEATRRLVKEYLCQLEERDFRIFFTGHKGFNIEVRPQALGIFSAGNRWQQFECRLEDINKTFGRSGDQKFVDKIHNDIRLHNSVNRWVGNNGKILNRMKFELSLREVNNLRADEISARAERLASSFLGLE